VTGQDHSRTGASFAAPSLSLALSCYPSAAGGSGSATLDDLLPHLRGLALEGIECTASAPVIRARWRPAGAVCPLMPGTLHRMLLGVLDIRVCVRAKRVVEGHSNRSVSM
jgi:hypothetical protein